MSLLDLDRGALVLARTHRHKPAAERVVAAYSRAPAAAAFAVSRPNLGVHYPSDVIAGALLGTAVAALLP